MNAGAFQDFWGTSGGRRGIMNYGLKKKLNKEYLVFEHSV